MMPDPSQMSGIPRPDGQVPPGTLVVRVIRGDFAHPLVGQEVTLDGEGGPRSEKTDATAHVTFAGLAAGATYTVRARAFGDELVAQPIEMPNQPGVKVMLVFKADEKALLGEPDGVGRVDARLPAGTIEVALVDGDDKPLAGVDVALAHAKKGGAAPDEQHAKTDAAGRARFNGLAASGEDGYLVAVHREGSGATRSKPFRLESASGALVALRVLPVTHDAKVVTIAKRSHLIAEVHDDQVDVVENFVLENASAEPFEAEGGLLIPLPDGAEGPQTGPNAPAELTVDGKGARWKGALPPGDTPVSIAFALPQHGHGVTLRQVLPVALDRLVLITDRYDGMSVEGTKLEKTERSMNGRNFWMVTGPGVPAGGAIEVKLLGLPHRAETGRDLAVALAALIALWGVARAWRRPPGEARGQLEAEAARLLDQLASLDGDQAAKKRADLTARLEAIYRKLDEAQAG
jgi:hypothetical protein